LKTRFIPQAARVFDLVFAPFFSSRIGGLHFHGSSTPIPAGKPLLLVANHVSWIDIAAIHAAAPHARFVSKADVLRWPLLVVPSGNTATVPPPRMTSAIWCTTRKASRLRSRSM
jgi:1-acyl-sn-glycerol-3-phosphate acyltransferase